MTGTGVTGAGLLLMAPLRLEARAVAQGAPGARIVRTGAGPLRSCRSVEEITAGVRLHGERRSPYPARGFDPPGAGVTRTNTRAVAVAGLAGGLSDDLEPGTVVVANRVIDETGNVAAQLSSAPLLAAELTARGHRALVGTVISARSVVQGSARRAALASLGAVAVDTETAWLLGNGWGLPSAAVRVIVDTPGRELRSLATVTGGIKALGVLSRAASVVAEWADTVDDREIVLASPRSFCAGVERAIETVNRAIDKFGAPVYVRRHIVHNRHVVADLEARGAVFVSELDEVPDDATVVFSAHGVAPAVRHRAAERGLRVVDATCPLVSKVHHEVRRFASRSMQVVLIGHAGHDETEGTLGEAANISLVENPADVAHLAVSDPERLAYVTQTTLSPDDVASVVEELTRLYPGVVGPGSADVCYATQNRQDAVRMIAPRCAVVIVVGSPTSSNANRLVEVARRSGSKAVLVEDERDLRFEHVRGASVLGVTAAASTPPHVVDAVVDALSAFGPTNITEVSTVAENASFSLPVEVR